MMLIVEPGATALIKARSKRRPYIVHVGIAFNGPDGTTLVAHNSRLGKNEHGGNVTIDTLQHVLKYRWLSSCRALPLSQTQLLEYTQRHYKRTFSVAQFNCEHFAYGFTGQHRSPQIMRWIIGIGLLVLAWVFARRPRVSV